MEVSSPLTIFKDYHLASETVEMIKNRLDQTPDEIAIRTSPVFPLGIHLDQDYIIGLDQPAGSAQDGLLRGTVEFQPAPSHPVEEVFHAGVAVSVSPGQKGLAGNTGNPVKRAGGRRPEAGNEGRKQGKAYPG
jgi:hypothetical protein